MAAINPPASSAIPLDIRKELVNPFTPWEVSQELFGQLQSPAPGAQYKKVKVLPSSKEWRFIWRYFQHLKPLRYTIKRVYFIYERHQQKAFEINLSSIEREAVAFPPTWDQESRAAQRFQAIQRWKETAQIFSPFTTQEPDGRVRSWEHTKVLPLWHGTNEPICDSICTSGFVYFGKKTIPGAAGAPPKKTDDGYFGSGIYFTNSARYSADIYSKGHLLLAWVSMREPFPAVGDPKQTDMANLLGATAYKNYNAHYVPVASTDPGNPYCAEYHPVQADQTPTCDEYVVFHKSQALPQYWVELEVELPYIQVPGKVPGFTSELIPHLMKILEYPQVDNDLKLRNFLNKHLAFLFNLPPDEDLNAEQVLLYEQITQLITPQGINKALRNQMVNAVAAQSLPFAEELPEEEGKQQAVIAKPKVAKPSPEKISMLEAVQKDAWALLSASKELREDKEIFIAAVKQNIYILQYATQQQKDDREIILAVVQKEGHYLSYASERLKDDREIVLAAIKRNPYAMEFASPRLKGDRKIVLSAIQHPWVLKVLNEQWKNDKEIVLAAVQKDEDTLEFASEQLRADREFILAIVKEKGRALKYASEELRSDREIVLAAVQQDGESFQYASQQLKEDREVVLAAVQLNAGALDCASQQFKSDREIVLKAVRQNGYAIQLASEQLKNDREIVLAAVRQNGEAIECVSPQFQVDEEIIRAAGLSSF